MKTRTLLAAACLALALLPGASVAADTAGAALSLKPPRSPGQASIAASPSSIGLSLSLPYTVIAGAATNAVPAEFSGRDRRPICSKLDERAQKAAREKVGGDLGKWLGKVARKAVHLLPQNDKGESCLDADIAYTVHRDGPVAAFAAGDHMRLSVPLSVTGHAGFEGDLARALRLDHKNFRGSLVATADIRLAVGGDWCPAIKVEPRYAWRDKAQLEVAPGAWIDIDRPAGPKINDLMRSAAKKLERAIKCDDVRKAAARLWHPYDVPLALPGDARLHVTATPLGIGLSGIRYTADAVLLTVGIDARVEASTAAPPEPSTTAELPPLRRVAPGAGRVTLLVPVRVDYDTLQAALAERLASHPFTQDTAAGRVSIAVTAVEIYPSSGPSGGRLAVGLGFTATTADPAMDASGWVYLVGEPVLDVKAQTVRVRDLSFTPQIDNKLWSVLSAAIGKRILASIEGKLVVDLKDRIDPVRERLQGALRELAAKQGVDLAMRDVTVEIRQIVPADQALEVLLGIRGSVAATIDAAALRRL
jgi:hypothetical protein